MLEDFYIIFANNNTPKYVGDDDQIKEVGKKENQLLIGLEQRVTWIERFTAFCIYIEQCDENEN